MGLVGAPLLHALAAALSSAWQRAAWQTLANDPRVSLANPVFERIHTAGVGTHLAAGSAVRMDDAAATRAPVRPAPMLGADTDAVLAEVLGLASAEVGRLHDAGIVAGAERDPTLANRG